MTYPSEQTEVGFDLGESYDVRMPDITIADAVSQLGSLINADND